MRKTSKSLHFSELPKEYRPLCDLCLPRPIHDKFGYENVLKIVEAMVGFEKQFSRDQNDYFVLLTNLVLSYENQKEEQSLKTALSFRQRLRHLLEFAEWSASDLGRFLGLDATMGNKILREDRKLTAEHIRKLSRHFSLKAEYFL
jgi:antitoxin component HigA of HigAB toxin-antitoxin module